MSKLWITSDCTCDLSQELLDKYNLDVLYFYIETDFGYFKDMAEITSTNIVEYFENGGQHIHTAAPDTAEYVTFFSKMLQKHDEIIHIAIGSTLSLSYKNAVEASKEFNGKVHVFDTGHLSTGIAHLVIKAVELASSDLSASEILSTLENYRSKVSTSFIAHNADYLHRTGRVSKNVKNICSLFQIHPVLFMKNGEIKIKTIKIGDYDKAVLRYVKKELRKASTIDRSRLFITYSTCPHRILTKIKKLVNELCPFEEILETKASATITSNCGANTIGVLFVRE